MLMGAILAGGQSSRLGQDKTQLCLFDDKTTLLQHTYNCLTSVVPDSLVVCRAEQSFAGMPCIHDALRGVGPIAGVLAALAHAKQQGHAAVLALSSDMPFMKPETLRRLVTGWNAERNNLLTAFHSRITHKTEMLAAIYAVQALPLFHRAVRSGQYGLYGVIPRERRKLLFADTECEQDFFNVNTADDLQRARQLVLRKK